MAKPALYFDDIYVGQEFPPLHFELTKEKVKNYIEAVGDPNPIYKKGIITRDGNRVYPVPPTIAALFVQQSYKEYVESPPGGIHAKQYFKFIKLLYVGEKLVVQAKVINKYLKRGRKYVVIETEAKDVFGEAKLYSLMTIIWAK